MVVSELVFKFIAFKSNWCVYYIVYYVAIVNCYLKK